jgi:ribonuclease HII
MNQERWVIGVDECGTGALAGPAVVCAAAMGEHATLPSNVRDSKLFKGKNSTLRDSVALALRDCLPFTAIVEVSHHVIDSDGLHRPLMAAFRKAVENLVDELRRRAIVGGITVYVDGVHDPWGKKREGAIRPPSIVVIEPKADAKYPIVSAASIVAKAHRDAMMRAYAEAHPEYSFEDNKGYPSSAHKKALLAFGPCPIHRKSYRPVLELMNKAGRQNAD